MGKVGDVGYVIGFDTNGPNKGPNRMGYDVFEIRFTDNNVETFYSTSGMNYCTRVHNPNATNDWYNTGGGYSHQSNGRYCAHYALTNINPNNHSKNYWESLY